MGQQPVVQVVGLDSRKGTLKWVFDEVLAQLKVERPTGSSTIMGGEVSLHTDPSVDEVI